MADHSEASAGIGHNNPPEPTIIERLGATYDEQIASIEAIAKRANSLPIVIEDDDTLVIAGEVVADASAEWKRFEKMRETEKAPFLAAGREVDGYFRDYLLRLNRISTSLSERLTQYNRRKAAEARRLKEEEERKAREEAEDKRLDAMMAAESGLLQEAQKLNEEAAAVEDKAEEIASQPTRAADLTRVRSDTGTTISTKTEVKARVVDWENVDLNKLRNFFKREDVEKALRAFTRINKKTIPITGVEFYDDETAQVRR